MFIRTTVSVVSLLTHRINSFIWCNDESWLAVFLLAIFGLPSPTLLTAVCRMLLFKLLLLIWWVFCLANWLKVTERFSVCLLEQSDKRSFLPVWRYFWSKGCWRTDYSMKSCAQVCLVNRVCLWWRYFLKWGFRTWLLQRVVAMGTAYQHWVRR